MTTPTRIGIRHAHPGILLYEFIVTTGWQHRFTMDEEDYGVATYYPPGGSCIVNAAANTEINGTVCSGFMDLVNDYPQLNTIGSRYGQVVQNDMTWYCVHFTDDTFSSISMLDVSSSATIPANTALAIIEGELNGVARVGYIPYSDTEFTVTGTAKAFLLTR